MKRSYSLFVVIGLLMTAMFYHDSAFSRSDQDIGNSTELISPITGDLTAIHIPCVITVADDHQVQLTAGKDDPGQDMYAIVDNDELVFRRSERICHLHNFSSNVPPGNLLLLSLPPPVVLRE